MVHGFLFDLFPSIACLHRSSLALTKPCSNSHPMVCPDPGLQHTLGFLLKRPMTHHLMDEPYASRGTGPKSRLSCLDSLCYTKPNVLTTQQSGVITSHYMNVGVFIGSFPIIGNIHTMARLQPTCKITILLCKHV